MVTFYKVGGAVRDGFIGRKSKDIDFAVEAESYAAMVDFIRFNGGKIYLERPEFVTVRAQYQGYDADFVLCRKDGYYSDGRRPDSVEVGNIYDDLARRDFRMNAIAIRMGDDKVIDPYNGVKDIHLGKINCVGFAEDRFFEDELRLLRALRFSLTLGYEMSTSIKKCLRSVNHINRLYQTVSKDRIRDEMMKMFSYDTLSTLLMLEEYPMIRGICFDGEIGMWLRPTTEAR